MASIKTLESRSVYKSDNGGEKFEIIAESGDTKFKVFTWSPKIAQVGFSGEVDKYTDKRGDTCVRLPQTGDFGGGGRAPRDVSDIRAQMAVKAAAGLFNGTGAADLKLIEDTARGLFAMVDRVKETNATTDAEKARQVLGGQEVVVPAEADLDAVDLSQIPF